jgi:type IV pilus assembly protein PilM
MTADAVFGKRQDGKTRSGVGLDMGSHSIKVAELAFDSGRPALKGFGLKPVTGLSRIEVSEAIRSLFNQAGIASRDTVISVSGPALIARFIQMPPMDRDALKSAVRFEAEKFIPFDINDCVTDFHILRKNEKDKKLELLLVAVKKDYVKDRIKLAEDAGLEVKLVDADSLAMANAFSANFPKTGDGKTCAVLNVGAAVTNLAILKDGAVCFVRDIMIGGNDINADMVKKLSMDKKAAEALKLSADGKAPEVAACVKSVLSALFDEVKMSFGYYENQSGSGVDEVYVSGGTSAASGLVEVFTESFGVKPVLWDPLGFSENNIPADIKCDFAVAAGLALR